MAKKIMLADDQRDIVKVLSDILSMWGYDVIPAFNGEETLERAAKERPDLILLDYRMPILDGSEVCRRIKNNEELKHIPVIFVTASPALLTPQVMKSTMADDSIRKPFKAEELREKIQHYIG